MPDFKPRAIPSGSLALVEGITPIAELRTEYRGERRDSAWWVLGSSPWGPIECGPYPAKEQAEEDRAGLVRFFAHRHEKRYLTTDPSAPITRSEKAPSAASKAAGGSETPRRSRPIPKLPEKASAASSGGEQLL